MISETRSIYFRHILNCDGSITAESFFRIKSDADTADAARSDAARWAGVAGGPFYVGGGTANAVNEHNDFVLDAVEIKQLDSGFVFDVCLTGRPRYTSWQLLPGSQRIEENNIITERKEYFYCGSDIPSYPHQGEIIIAEDERRMICSMSKVTDEGAGHLKLTVVLNSFYGEVFAADPENGNLDKIHDFYCDNAYWRKAVLYWQSDIYGERVAELRFHDESYVPEWASDGYVLEKMDCVPDGSSGYFVELTARKIVTELLSVRSEENENGRSVIAVYNVKNSEKERFSGLLGTVPLFADDRYIVNRISQKIITPALLEITVEAVERTGTQQMGDIAVSRTEIGTDFKKAVFFVAAENVAGFRANLSVGAFAEWAGENYFLESFAEKETAGGSTFELKAVEVYTRMISMSQEEKFSGLAVNGLPCREVVYKSVWQVRAEDLDNFCNITGNNAEWCSDDAIITEVVPKQQSIFEYHVTIKAERRSNPELHKIYNYDNYESLSGRTDLDCELVDFRFSPKDCGYYINSEGLYELIPGWRPESECPISSKNVLHPCYINAITKILRISETTYLKGSMNRAIDDMIEWNSSRVFNGRVGNYSGSYLKSDLHAEEIYDSHGVRWTKITKVYDMAPNGATWSPYYFRQVGI